MKKAFLFTVALATAVCGWAQKKNVNNAVYALSLNPPDNDEAKTYIDAAVLDESTKNDPKAWFIRGEVYRNLSLMNSGKYKDVNLELESARSYYKAAELDPNYNKDEMPNRLDYTTRVYFNQGYEASRNKDYAKAYEYYSMPLNIAAINGGKMFAGNKIFDTIVANAAINRAYAAYNAKDYDKAEADLQKYKSLPIVKSADNYKLLKDIYEMQNKQEQLKAIIEEGLKEYPDNAELRNAELTMYIKAGKQDELVKKLEAAISKEPTNSDLHYILGLTYDEMAAPKDQKTKPANAADLKAKAETAYLAAIANDKSNHSEYNFVIGALYYNSAIEVNNQMNALGGSREENKKADELKAKRNAIFDKAAPYFEKTVTLIGEKASKTQEESNNYVNALTGLRQIYALQSKTDKVAEVKAKLDAVKK